MIKSSNAWVGDTILPKEAKYSKEASMNYELCRVTQAEVYTEGCQPGESDRRGGGSKIS